jgi:HPt (histidine-containing phosphotransfer) domain-containing protein
MNRFAADNLASVIDLEVLKERCLGNLDLVDRVLAKFTGQVDADLDALDRAIHEQNPAKAAQLAHRIKGIAGSVEARQLYADASRTEQFALDNCVGELPGELVRLRNDQTTLLATLEKL